MNGSAVGGTHFTHRSGQLTFSAGSSASQSISVAENGANTPSSSATAYSNADRTYQMEIYRVEGGATIGTARATRKLTNGSGYTVDGTALSISEPGTYILSGTCEDGSVTVKKGTQGVTLVLNGLALTSADTAPITCNKSTEVTLLAAQGTENILADSEQNNDETYPDNTEE